jgi:hypothetical protein
MTDNIRFYLLTILTILSYYFGFSIATTGIFHNILVLLGSLALIMAVYLLGKIKLLELRDILKYSIYKIKGGKD